MHTKVYQRKGKCGEDGSKGKGRCYLIVSRVIIQGRILKIPYLPSLNKGTITDFFSGVKFASWPALNLGD